MEGQDKDDEIVRVATTFNSSVKECQGSESALFNNVKLADKMIEGVVLTFNDLRVFKSCESHKKRLLDGVCSLCIDGAEPVTRADYVCKLTIEDETAEDGVTSITVFKRFLEQYVKYENDDTEEELAKEMDNVVVGKEWRIDYDVGPGESNGGIAVKITSV